MNVSQWIQAFNDGKFDAKDCQTQIDAGWYDWFCQDKSLSGRLKRMASKVKRIAKSSKIDQEKMGLMFKNNCPLYGGLYDDFRFLDANGSVVYTIVPKTGHTSLNGQAEVWGNENDFDGPIIEGSWKDICNFFGV